MPTLHFSGYSDDTFGCDLIDYDNSASGRPIVFRVSAGDDSFFVWGQFCPGPAAGWLVGVAPVEEDFDGKSLPAWPMQLRASDRPYSPELVIEAPAGVTVALHREP